MPPRTHMIEAQVPTTRAQEPSGVGIAEADLTRGSTPHLSKLAALAATALLVGCAAPTTTAPSPAPSISAPPAGTRYPFPPTTASPCTVEAKGEHYSLMMPAGTKQTADGWRWDSSPTEWLEVKAVTGIDRVTNVITNGGVLENGGRTDPTGDWPGSKGYQTWKGAAVIIGADGKQLEGRDPAQTNVIPWAGLADVGGDRGVLLQAYLPKATEKSSPAYLCAASLKLG